MRLEIVLGGHFRHSVPMAAEKIQTLRARHKLTVAEAVNCFRIDCNQIEILVTVNGANIPPEERERYQLQDGQTLAITPWYAHLSLQRSYV